MGDDIGLGALVAGREADRLQRPRRPNANMQRLFIVNADGTGPAPDHLGARHVV